MKHKKNRERMVPFVAAALYVFTCSKVMAIDSPLFLSMAGTMLKMPYRKKAGMQKKSSKSSSKDIGWLLMSS